MSGRLNQAQVKQYREEGFLVLNEPVFGEAKFAGLKNCFEGLLGEWVAKKVSRSPEHMDVPHFWEPKLFAWLMDDEVLDIVESLIGPDIALWSSHFICKPPAVGKRVPWHEDSSYWKGRIDPMEVVTVWLAVDPSTRANGNMQVIPRTHHNGFSAYEDVKGEAVFGTEIRQDQFDVSKAVDCILAPNECSLHDGRLIHGSAANTGAMRRCGYTMRYMPTSVKHTVPPGDSFEIYLARGKDRAGNEYGDPTKANRKWMEAHPDGQPAGH